MLLMRSREEAEGESRMMGSGRRVGFLGRETRAGFVFALAVVVVDDWWPGLVRLRLRNTSAVLRMWEKSWLLLVSSTCIIGFAEGSYGRFDAP